jgi:transposase
MSPPIPSSYERYLAVDLHKHYVVIGGLNVHLEVILPPRRVELSEWSAWARKNLRKRDILVVEATTNAWDFYDEVAPLVGRVVVANAGKIAKLVKSKVKTDRTDVLKLAKLLVAGLIPEVWVPPDDVRELRTLMAHRRQLVKNCVMLKNRLQSVLHRHQLVPPDGGLFSQSNRTWWDNQPVSVTERLHIKHDLGTLDALQPQLEEVDDEILRLSTSPRWFQSVTYLLQLPGFGITTTMTILAAIGDITRFEKDKQLVGYSGLGAGVHASGETYRTGHITKEGRRDLRWALVEAAWAAVNNHSHWKSEFDRLSQRMCQNKAIVAIARKLLIAVWHVLTEFVADKHAEPEMVATKLMRWSWELSDEQRDNLSTRQFIRLGLMHLKLANHLTHITYGNRHRRISSTDELLAVRPEFRSLLENPAQPAAT